MFSRARALSRFTGHVTGVRFQTKDQGCCSRQLSSTQVFHQGLSQPTGPEVPLYDALNIQMKGYDFAVLEKFARYVHRTAERVGIEVEDSWATPAQNLKVTQLKPESNVVVSEYQLNMYERNVQIVDVPSTLLPVLVNIVEACLPAGIKMRIHPHTSEHTEVRYVPDLELKSLKTQLQDIKDSRAK